MTTARLQIADYVIFSLMLIVSSGIGVFYACTGGKQKTSSEFLMANKQMGIFPVALSLLASFMSAITLLGTPSEMYQFTTQYWLIGPSYIFVCLLSAHVFLPVFYHLQITSVYEYLQLRFNKIVRLQGCATFLVQMIIYMGIVLYAPALALSAVTGLQWYISVLILGTVCTFYTTIGGMKAVMWTDVYQIAIMFSGMIAIVVVGTVKVGGPGEVWDALHAYNKTEFWNFDPSPLERHTVWCLVFGGACTWLVIYGVNQSQVQRYLSTPTLRKAQIAIWINLPGLWGLLTVCALAGVVAFAYYSKIKGCDPLSVDDSGISKGDQILPLFVMEVLSYPGFPGLFIATIFSGALSTVSSGVNALAAVTLEDIIKPFCTCFSHYFATEELSERNGALVSKVLSVSYGLLALLLAFVASQMGDVLQAALGLFGMVGGPLLGLFILGVVFPCANWQGACAGHLIGEVLSLWVGFGSYMYPPDKHKPPVEISRCNVSSLIPPPAGPTLPYAGLEIYKLSYMWQGAWSIFCTVTVGLTVSALTGFQKRTEIDPALICPAIRKVCGLKLEKGTGCAQAQVATTLPHSSSTQPLQPHPPATAASVHAYANPAFQNPASYSQPRFSHSAF